MLYLPDVPYKHNKDNPESYRNPKDRSLLYEDVSLEVEKGIFIRGWYIKHTERLSTEPERLIVFFQENAGNLGLRLDYFE